jgi:phospho-N-acetylmuramoyl-pentapeptide-transferase
VPTAPRRSVVGCGVTTATYRHSVVALIVAGAISFALALLLTPVLIRLLRRRGIGQPIHDEVQHHTQKAGTPTIGGVVAPLSLLTAFPVALVVSGHFPSRLGVAAAVTVVAMGAVGLLDDGMKVFRERNLGLRERQKTVLQTIVSLGYALTVLGSQGSCRQLAFTNCQHAVLSVPSWMYVVVFMAVFWGSTNAVNFTDGIEGLLAGAAAVTFLVLTGIGFWVFRHPGIYQVPHALEFALVAACLAGSMGGLLWWNVSPMTIFMGDTGSLALGAGLVVICSGLGLTLLVPVIGVLYVGVGASSFLQRVWFKWTRRRGTPRRLFRMAPIHHHFELVGWSESTIVVRFWIVNAIAAGFAVLLFYGDALRYLPN